jgi:hypothetical protein
MIVLGPRLASAALVLCVLTADVVASAAPSPPDTTPAPAPLAADKGMAEALFRAAKDLQAEGKVTEACAKYVESHRLDPKPGTILNVATCHDQEGRTATAWADYAEAATFAARAHQADREKLARSKVDELGKRLSYVTFRFPEVKDLVVLLDGKALTPAAAGTRVPIDPGEHELDARAPGKAAWTTRVKIDPGPGERTVVVPPLVDEGSVSGPPAPASASVGSVDGLGSMRDGGAQRALGWVALGVGVAGAAAGTFFGVRTLSQKSTVDEHCAGSHCDDAGLRANDSAKDSATLSTIAFVFGGVALAAGIVLLVTAPRSRPATTASPVTSSRFGARGGGLRAVW